MTDTRYLKRRGGRWYFQLAVPADLQASFGRKVIQSSLATADLREAQRLRWSHVGKAHEAFDRLRGRRTLTADEIETTAEHRYREILEAAAAAREAGSPAFFAPPVPSPQGHDEPHDPELAGVRAALDDTLEALRAEDFRSVSREAEGLASDAGAVMPPDAPAYRSLCRSLLVARAEAFRAIAAYKQGETYTPARPFNPTSIDPVTLDVRTKRKTPQRATSGLSVSDATARYVAERMRDPSASWSNQTKAQYEASFRLFGEHVEGAALPAITRQDASSFLDTLARLHKDWGRAPEASKLPLSDLLERYSGEPGLTNKTLNRHATALSGFFRWAKSNGLYEGDNPFSNQMRAVGRKNATGYRPFTEDELGRLFRLPLFTETPTEQRLRPNKHTVRHALLWAPLIALFSGMRSGEICQLRAKDVREENGVWFFNVSEEAEGQSVKSAAGVRRVPVHSMLERCGLLEYVRSVSGHPSGLLFPALKPGGPDRKLNWYFGKRFMELRKEAGLIRSQLAFHSFRKNVGTALERARVPESEAVQVLGHEKLSMSYTVYSLGLDMAGLRSVVEKIVYPHLDLMDLH